MEAALAFSVEEEVSAVEDLAVADLAVEALAVAEVDRAGNSIHLSNETYDALRSIGFDEL